MVDMMDVWETTKAEYENIWHQENNGCSPGASIPKDVEKPWKSHG